MTIIDILTYLVVVCFAVFIIVFIINVVLGILVVFLTSLYMKLPWARRKP